MSVLTKTEFNFPGQTGVYHGKVRDVYSVGDRLVMVATDRISAFDVVLPKGIPFKGQMLNQIAAKFLDATTDICPNWKLSSPDPMVTVGLRCEGFAVEMIVRGYLCGSAWRAYKSGVREMFDMLQKGWAIGLIMDQDTNRRSGIVLDFFGKPTNCVPGAASMARFQGVPIFPAFMHRDEHGFHTLIVQDPVFVEKTKDKREDIRRTTQVLTKCIEDHVRRYPEEWFWLHDRWKSMREEY